MAMDRKLIEVKLILEVGTYSDVDPDKLAKAWVEEHLPQDHVFRQHYKESLYGDIELRTVKVLK